MAELAPLDNYQGSEPAMVVMPVPDTSVGGPGQELLFELGSNAVWRIRCLTFAGFRFAGAGASILGIFIQPSVGIRGPWSNGGSDSNITATVSQQITGSDNFSYTWSTETTSTYFSNDGNGTWVAQAGIPLVFLPPQTQISVQCGVVGGTSGVSVVDGFMQIEKFPQATTQAGDTGGTDNLYLLPATG